MVQLLPTKSLEIWESLNILVNNDENFRKYRAAVKKAGAPCIPYLGMEHQAGGALLLALLPLGL